MEVALSESKDEPEHLELKFFCEDSRLEVSLANRDHAHLKLYKFLFFFLMLTLDYLSDSV